MVEYLYFVKFENENSITDPSDWDEDVFETFDEAKEFARSMISRHPEIHQTEIFRNDFGECVDVNPLGAIWTWKEEMSDILDNDELMLSKSSTFDEHDFDSEFDYSDMVFDEDFNVGDEVLCKSNNRVGKAKSVKDDVVEVEFATDGKNPARTDKYYKQNLKPVPADMTIESLVETMEENEDMVECKKCFKLVPKEDCFQEVGIGYLCPVCIMDLDSEGVDLEFTRDALGESYNPKELVSFEYRNLKTAVAGNQRDADDWDEYDYVDDYTYKVTKEDVATAIWESFMDDEDDALIPGGVDGIEALEKDDSLWNAFMVEHFDTLFDKHYNELLNYYRDAAEEEFSYSVTYDDYRERRDSWRYDRFDETLERDAVHKRLTMCPECGEDTFDLETQFCSNCGFN